MQFTGVVLGRLKVNIFDRRYSMNTNLKHIIIFFYKVVSVENYILYNIINI